MPKYSPFGPLSTDLIIDTTAQIIQKYGVTKATVTDVAQALGVSHGAIYRFFPSKEALWEAVVTSMLDDIARKQEQAPVLEDPVANLRAWFDSLHRQKWQESQIHPEVFRAYQIMAPDFPPVVQRHLQRLENQVAKRLETGNLQGTWHISDTQQTAWILLRATVWFHNPGFATQWGKPDLQENFDTLWAFLIRGLLSTKEIS